MILLPASHSVDVHSKLTYHSIIRRLTNYTEFPKLAVSLISVEHGVQINTPPLYERAAETSHRRCEVAVQIEGGCPEQSMSVTQIARATCTAQFVTGLRYWSFTPG